jgi:hypothetical protein
MQPDGTYQQAYPNEVSDLDARLGTQAALMQKIKDRP